MTPEGANQKDQKGEYPLLVQTPSVLPSRKTHVSQAV